MRKWLAGGVLRIWRWPICAVLSQKIDDSFPRSFLGLPIYPQKSLHSLAGISYNDTHEATRNHRSV